MVELFHTMFPIFGLIFFGFILVRSNFFDAHVVRGLNNLVYWIGLPSMLIVRLSQANYSAGEFLWISGIVVSASLIVLFLSWGVGRIMKLNPACMGTFIQASFRGNLAFTAVPVVTMTFIPYGSEVATMMETLTILGIAPIMLFFNLASTVVLIAGKPRTGVSLWRVMWLPILKNPILIAAMSGALMGLTAFPIPAGIFHSLDTLAGLASPLALLCIGCSLYLVSPKGSVKYAVVAGILKTLVAPLIGLLLIWLLELKNYAVFIPVVMLCTPTATVSYIFTRQMGGDEGLASSSIVISTLMSFVTLSVWMLIAGWIGLENFIPPTQ